MLEIAVCRLQAQTSRVHLQTRIRGPSRSKQHGKAHYRLPAHDQFSIANEAWLAIQREIQSRHLTPHEWCRMAALERLNGNCGLSKSERFLFHHLVRAQYLITHGFQLLADHKLTSEEWKQLRVNSKHRDSELGEGALAKHAQYDRERPRHR